MKWPERLVWLCLGIVVAGAIWLAVQAYRAFYVTIHDAYAVEWTAGTVVDFMKSHPVEWPRGWDDLRESFEQGSKKGSCPFSFAELQKRVVIDWNTQPSVLADAKLREDEQPPFRVIWLRDGHDTHWSSTEPNQLIWNYLHDR